MAGVSLGVDVDIDVGGGVGYLVYQQFQSSPVCPAIMEA